MNNLIHQFRADIANKIVENGYFQDNFIHPDGFNVIFNYSLVFKDKLIEKHLNILKKYKHSSGGFTTLGNDLFDIRCNELFVNDRWIELLISCQKENVDNLHSLNNFIQDILTMIQAEVNKIYIDICNTVVKI